MMIKLKQHLVDHGIEQSLWAKSVKQASGKPLSDAAASLLLNKGKWPKATPKNHIKLYTELFFKDHSIPYVKSVWEEVNSAGGIVETAASVSEDDELPTEVEMLTQEARRRFGLIQDPFRNDVHGPDDLFMSADFRYIREAMWQAARTGGLICIIGESGAGKTVLRRDIIDRANRDENMVVIMLTIVDKSQVMAATIAEALIRTLAPHGAKIPVSSEAKARMIQKLLTEGSRAGLSYVLMIEEAHDLKLPMIKQLKRFWELEDGFKKLLGIILIAQPEMKTTLNVAHNWSAREFINRCEVAELLPLDSELEGYLRLKFGRLNIELEKIFATDAFDAIRAKLGAVKHGAVVTSTLYPLMVNNLVTKAMNLTASMNKPLVNAAMVKGV